MTQHVPTPPPDQQAEVEHTLDAYEHELMQASEEDKLAPSPGPGPDQETLEEAARHTLAKSERLTVRLSKPDLHAITTDDGAAKRSRGGETDVDHG